MIPGEIAYIQVQINRALDDYEEGHRYLVIGRLQDLRDHLILTFGDVRK